MCDADSMLMNRLLLFMRLWTSRLEVVLGRYCFWRLRLAEDADAMFEATLFYFYLNFDLNGRCVMVLYGL